MSDQKQGKPVQFNPGEDCGDGNGSAVMPWRISHVRSMRADMAELRKGVAELAEIERVAKRKEAHRRQLAVGK